MSPKKKAEQEPSCLQWVSDEEPQTPDDPNIPQILPQQIEFVSGATVRDGYYRLDIKAGGKYTLSRRDLLNLYSVCPNAVPGDLRKRVELWNLGR